MAGMEDVFGKNPNRPDHPDFWRISEVLLANDGDMEAATTPDAKEDAWKARTAGVVDIRSVTYAGIQRTIRAFGTLGQGAAFGRTNGLTIEQHTAISALWVDAFVAGAMYQRNGGHQDDAGKS